MHNIMSSAKSNSFIPFLMQIPFISSLIVVAAAAAAAAKSL